MPVPTPEQIDEAIPTDAKPSRALTNAAFKQLAAAVTDLGDSGNLEELVEQAQDARDAALAAASASESARDTTLLARDIAVEASEVAADLGAATLYNALSDLPTADGTQGWAIIPFGVDEGIYEDVAGSPAAWTRRGSTAAIRAADEADRAEAAADTATAAAIEAGIQSHYGSVMMPFENGRHADSSTRGQFTVTGLRTAISGTNSATDFWRGAYACVAICDPHRSRTDAQNHLPMVFASNTNQGAARSMGLLYYPRAHPTAGLRQRFRFFVRGETAPGSWIVDSAVIPDSARGPFAVYPYNDGTNAYLHVLDISSGTWYDGSAVAKPASWLGISTVAMTHDFVVGCAGAVTFSTYDPTSPQSAAYWRGSIGTILLCNSAFSKARVEAIVNGADPLTEASADGATVRVLISPVAGGKLSPTVTGTVSGLSITQQGVVYPGPTMRRQGTSAWLRLDPYFHPEHFPVENGQTEARIKLSGTVSGLTGFLMYRVVLLDGRVWQGWTNSRIPVVDGAFSGHVLTPEFRGDAQIQVAMSSDMTVIACSHSDCQSGPVIHTLGQSELNFATNQGRVNTGAVAAFDPTLPPRAKNIVFAQRDLLSGYMLGSVTRHGSFIGEGAVGVINAIRAETDRSILICNHAESGTSIKQLLDDSDSTRNWTDFVGVCELISARGDNGEYIATGVVIAGWDASLSGGDNVVAAEYIPLLQGVASANITQAQIDHWLFDGTLSPSAQVVAHPMNRATVAAASATATDSSAEANQRDIARNYAHRLGYKIGPEWTAHKLQGENAASGVLVSGTHPEPGDWEGSIETGVVLGNGILLSLGISQYPGPVFFEHIRLGSAANKVIVELGDPRPYPGLGLSVGAPGYSTDEQIVARSALRLHVKKNGGDPGAGFEASIDGGAWSKLNVTSGEIISGRGLELTLASTPSVSVAIRHKPGGTGNYSTATITQEAWRSGLLYFTGEEYASGEPNSVDDLVRLGHEVAGSNQELTLTL